MEYTSFAIVTIESLWPSPVSSALEVGAVEIDKSGNITDTSAFKGEERGRLGSDRAYYNNSKGIGGFKRGYYILVALNVTNVNTGSDISGNNSFDVSFTPDKILYVDEKEGTMTIEELIRATVAKQETAAENRLHSSFTSSLSKSILDTLKKSGIQYTEIPVSGTSFNIKDVVEIGDTVSIWLYNDPEDFAIRPEYFTELPKGTIRDMQAITGSHNRQMPMFASDDVAEYGVSSYTNITNKAQASAVADATKADPKPLRVSFEDVKAAAIDIAVKAGTYRDMEDGRGNRGSVQTYAMNVVPTTKKGEIDYSHKNMMVSSVDIIGYYLSDMLDNNQYVTYHQSQNREYVTPTSYRGDSGGVANRDPAGKGALYVYNAGISDASTTQAMLYFISKMYQLQGALDDPKVFFEKGKDVVLNTKAKDLNVGFEQEAVYRSARFRPAIFHTSNFDASLFISGYNALKTYLEGIAAKEAAGLKKAVSYKAPQTDSERGGRYIDRAILYSNNSGDTPYLIMRGHIKQSSSTHSAQGVNITISGSGYEYPMEKHMVFYDDAQTFEGSLVAFQDYTSYYSSLKPPQVIVAFLTKWMPKKVKWGPLTESANTQTTLAGVKINSNSKSYLVRGSTIFERNRKSLLTKYETDETPTQDSSSSEEMAKRKEAEIKNDSRVFTPINYVDITRVAEFTRALDRADPSGLIATSTVPTTIQSRDTIMAACKKVANVSNLYELFVDETGRLIYRVSTEAWERTPRPAYIPSVESDILISFTENESDEAIYTVIDIQPTGNASLGAGTNQLTRYNWGRAIPRSGYVPINVDNKESVPNMFSPELFRYGMRYQYLSDYYGVHNDIMRPKAYNLLRFYKEPLKKANATVIADPTYRKGNTVYVSLKNRKTRSKAVIDIDATLAWLKHKEMTDEDWERYIGVEERLQNWEKFYQNQYILGNFFTRKAYDMDNGKDNQGLDSELSVKFIRRAIISTLEALKKPEYGGFTHISAEMFPTTLWYYLHSDNVRSHTGDQPGAMVRKAYSAALKFASNGDKSGFTPEVIPYLRFIEFNSFISRQYYIERVEHSFAFGASATTTLTLSYGQDCITIVDPRLDGAIGFMSVERKVRDFYVDEYAGEDPTRDKKNMETYEIPHESPWRKLLKEQYKEDKLYKEGSLIYEGAKVRNTANFMHKLHFRLFGGQK